MSAGTPTAPTGDEPRSARILVFVLLPLCALMPPETRGEALAGAAALIVLLALLCCGRWSRPASALLVAAGLLAPVLGRAALAPGAAVEPTVIAVLALAAGLACGTVAGALEGLARAAALAGGAVAAHGLYQKLWGFERVARALAQDPALPDREAVLAKLQGGRAFAGFSTPAALGGMLGLSLPLTVALAVGARGRVRAAWIAVAVLQLAGLLATASATAAAALLGATALAAVVRGGSRRVLAVGALALAALLAGVVMQRDAILDPAGPASPFRLRAGNLRAALEMGREHPWLGVGPGGYAESYLSHRRASDNEARHAHDLPLELVAELGWPAGLALAAAFYALFLGPLGSARGAAEPALRRGAAVALAAFALHNLADYTAFMPSIVWPAALLRGSLAAPREAAPTAIPSARFARAAALGVVLAAGVLAALAGLSREARVAARDAAHHGDGPHALELSRRASRLAPWDVDAALAVAEAALREAAGDGDDASLVRAARHAAHAVRLSPLRPAARELRARLRVRRGDLFGAWADLEQAVRSDPTRAEYRAARDALARRIPGPG